MTLQCHHCDELFSSNHALYKHKSLAHPKSTSLLANDEPNLLKRSVSDDNKVSKYRKTDTTTLSSSAVKEFDSPEETLTDLVSRPELLLMNDFTNESAAIDWENNSGDEVCTKSNQTVGDVAVSESPNSRESHEDEPINNNKVNRHQMKIDWNQRKLHSLEVECQNKIRENQEYHNKIIADLKAEYMTELRKYEDTCAAKIKILNNQFLALKDGEDDTGELTMTIFNFSAIGEILEIQRLIKNRQIDEVLRAHFTIFQKVLLGLSFGVLPLCQPQRSRVTNEQRILVEQLQSASKPSAKRILKEKEAIIVNLFEIVKDSIKLARNVHNKYGSS